MSEHSYTHLEDIPVIVCDDCGATAFSEDRVIHFKTCDPGGSKRWAEYYDQQVEEA